MTTAHTIELVDLPIQVPVARYGGSTHRGGTGLAGSSYGALLKKDAALYWPDGRPAGKARRDVTLTFERRFYRGDPPPAGTRDCQPVDLEYGLVRLSEKPAPLAADRTLSICFDRASIGLWGL